MARVGIGESPEPAGFALIAQETGTCFDALMVGDPEAVGVMPRVRAVLPFALCGYRLPVALTLPRMIGRRLRWAWSEAGAELDSAPGSRAT